jgi:hypothetical protein
LRKNLPQKKSVILFGAGSLLKKTYKKIQKKYNPTFIADNDSRKWGGNLYDIKIVDPDFIFKHKSCEAHFIITSSFVSEITKQLKARGIRTTQIQGYQEFLSRGPIESLMARILLALDSLLIGSLHFSFSDIKNLFSEEGLNCQRFHGLGADSEDMGEVSQKPNKGIFSRPRHIRPRREDQVLYKYRNAIVYEASRVIKAQNGVMQVFRLDTDDLAFHDYSDAAIKHVNSRKILQSRSFEMGAYISSGVHLMGSLDGNYYHGLVEVISNLYLYEKHKCLDGSTLLVSESLLNVKSLRVILEILTEGVEVKVIKKYHYYQVGNLTISKPLNFIVPNLRGNIFPKYKHQITSSEALAFIREPLLERLNVHPRRNFPERVFLIRESFARPYNQNELLEVASDFGFQGIDFSELDIFEQVQIFQSSKFIIGPSGAAWTNLLFSNSSVSALIWMPKSFKEFACWEALARASNVRNLKTCFYQGRGISSVDEHMQFYHIEKGRFRQWLSELLDRI